MIPLIITSFVNPLPGTSYEVTDQNNEGTFSSLSRNFDKTLEHINSDDNSAVAADEDKDDNKVSDKQDDGPDVLNPESTTQNNNLLRDSNETRADTIENGLSKDPSLANSTESVVINPIDLETSL
jgi:hypothetical protein